MVMATCLVVSEYEFEVADSESGAEAPRKLKLAEESLMKSVLERSRI